MARQARSEATRQRIITAAVDLFNEIGYPSAGLAEIVERAQMTKGALYYHFDSKEDLAVAIISDGGAVVITAFQEMAASPAPALETMIHGSFVVASLMSTNTMVRTAVQLCRAMAGFSEAARRAYADWLNLMKAAARRAQAEGDVRGDLDPGAVATCVVSAIAGAELVSNAQSGGDDLIARLTSVWEILLPAIAEDSGLDYFREFLGRESLRHRRPRLTIE